MSIDHVGHAELVKFAIDKVNLPRDKADKFRAQARNLREKLKGYLKEHPDFALRKMLLSGSLAKGTGLRTLNDIDVACYISGSDVPSDIDDLMEYLAERLRKAFPNFKPEQVQPKTYCVTVSFAGTGLDVDIVPILYDGDPDWYGNLVNQDDGSFLRTCVPRHLEFIRKRKSLAEKDFAQVIRLAKYWVRKEKRERDNFRFKSFMVEMILSKMLDDGQDFSDYPEALQAFFSYIANSGMNERIVFDDYYLKSKAEVFGTPIEIIDPVNEENNVSQLYTQAQADDIVDAALDAGDAIDAALRCPTKQDTIRHWQRVFGSAFQG
ncbi:MAG: nucleotidyltransferase [Rhodobacteraceae bacterium]|nr:nucleotidyltransferase [Paracoccaceae bacterium]